MCLFTEWRCMFWGVSLASISLMKGVEGNRLELPLLPHQPLPWNKYLNLTYSNSSGFTDSSERESRLRQDPPVDWCHSYWDSLNHITHVGVPCWQSPQAAALQKHGLDYAILAINTNWTKQNTPQPSLHPLGTHRRDFRSAPVVRYHCSHHHSQGGLKQRQLISI